jgi:predicted glycosyltransferase
MHSASANIPPHPENLRPAVEGDPGSVDPALTGSPMVHSFRLSPKMDYVKLPCVHRQARNKYIAKFLRTSFREISQMREDIIFAAFKSFRPDIVLVDKVPVGIKGELLRSIEWLKSRASRRRRSSSACATSSTTPSTCASCGSGKNFYDTLERFYDSIWVFGSAKVYDLVAEYGFPESHRPQAQLLRLHHAEPGAARQSRGAARARASNPASSCW